jgi:parvulin-like peptidyl-prolyl isomerase
MKNIFIWLSMLMIFVFACSNEKSKVILQPGTPGYLLAKDISTVVTAADPDSNRSIIVTESFEVTTGEVIQEIHKNFGEQATNLKKMDPTRIKQILEDNARSLAEKKLILTTAKDRGFIIENQKLDSLMQDQYKRAGSEEAFLSFVEKKGFTIENVKEDISNAFIIEQYIKSVLSEETSITEEELKDRYKRRLQIDRTATVYHVLLMTQNKTEAEKAEIHKKMKKILARAKKGENFAQLAKTYSEDPGVKNNGGLYENFERGQMVKPFEDAAFSIPVGEISDIVETRYGYHILKIVDRQKESRTFEDLKPDLEKELKKEKEMSVVNVHMEKLKEDANYEKISL